MAIDLGMTSSAQANAKKHVLNVCSQGMDVVLFEPATKDEFGTPLTEVTQTLKAFPVRLTPYDRKTMEKISWSEDTDILCFISKSAVDKLSLTTQMIQSRYKGFRFNDKTYDIRYIENYSPFGTDFLYIVIGGKV